MKATHRTQRFLVHGFDCNTCNDCDGDALPDQIRNPARRQRSSTDQKNFLHIDQKNILRTPSFSKTIPARLHTVGGESIKAFQCTKVQEAIMLNYVRQRPEVQQGEVHQTKRIFSGTSPPFPSPKKFGMLSEIVTWGDIRQQQIYPALCNEKPTVIGETKWILCNPSGSADDLHAFLEAAYHQQTK
eukprot:scaffold1690_cov177-Ochromonas_danica.AAC.16